MVNASLNWASIVGIVLAVGGALLYFMRSFKPALARDYDVFFAAVGLLCGGILFFQGWRLDPILQFGQFLLAGTTVFFAYESVRLRGVTTEQARRSSYFEDDEPPAPRPRVGGRPGWDSDTDRFDEPQPLRRRIRSLETEEPEEEAPFYRPRRTARPAIPERAASRRSPDDEDWDSPASRASRDQQPFSRGAPRSGQGGVPAAAGGAAAAAAGVAAGSSFGARRRDREAGPEPRRGSRPVPAPDNVPRSSRRPGPTGTSGSAGGTGSEMIGSTGTPGVPQGSPIRGRSVRGQDPASADAGNVSDADFTPLRPSPSPRPRDNSSRFDD